MVIAVVLPERDSFALGLRFKTFLPSTFQSSAKLRNNIQNTQMSRSFCCLYCWEQIHLHLSEQIQWDLGNLVHTSEKIVKIGTNLHTINQHCTVCFLSLIVFLQFNSPFEFFDLYSCEQCFGHLSCCSLPVVLFHTIWKHSSFFFCIWDLSVVFSKASELIFKFRTITAASQNSLRVNFGRMLSYQTANGICHLINNYIDS